MGWDSIFGSARFNQKIPLRPDNRTDLLGFTKRKGKPIHFKIPNQPKPGELGWVTYSVFLKAPTK